MTKERSDTSHVETKLMKDALSKIVPPMELSEEELVYWDKITIARHSWTDIDLVLACSFAQTLCMLDSETLLLKSEGSVVKNERGTMVMNPRHAVREQLTRQALALSGKLHVHAAATMGEVSAQRKKNQKKADAVQAFKDLDDDDLIARPN